MLLSCTGMAIRHYDAYRDFNYLKLIFFGDIDP